MQARRAAMIAMMFVMTLRGIDSSASFGPYSAATKPARTNSRQNRKAALHHKRTMSVGAKRFGCYAPCVSATVKIAVSKMQA